jgi:hypothetical protein
MTSMWVLILRVDVVGLARCLAFARERLESNSTFYTIAQFASRTLNPNVPEQAQIDARWSCDAVVV